jgi:hypothetical protein
MGTGRAEIGFLRVHCDFLDFPIIPIGRAPNARLLLAERTGGRALDVNFSGTEFSEVFQEFIVNSSPLRYDAGY